MIFMLMAHRDSQRSWLSQTQANRIGERVGDDSQVTGAEPEAGMTEPGYFQ